MLSKREDEAQKLLLKVKFQYSRLPQWIRKWRPLINDNKNVNSLIVDDWRRLVGLNTKEDLHWIESQKIV